MRRSRIEGGAGRGRRATRDVSQGHGTQNDPYSLSGSDEEATAPKHEKQAEKKDRETQEEDLDRRLKEAGVEIMGMLLDEKESLAKILLQSAETVKQDETARKKKFESPEAELKRQPLHAEHSKTRASKRPLRNTPMLANDSDSTQDAVGEGKQWLDENPIANNGPTTIPQTSNSSAEERVIKVAIDKKQIAILESEPNAEGRDSPDYEVITNFASKGQGKRSGKRLKLDKEESNKGGGRSRQRRLSLSKEKEKGEAPMEIESSGSETTDESALPPTPQKLVDTKTTKTTRAVKRPQESKKEGRRKRQKSVSKGEYPEVYSADDSESQEEDKTKPKTETESKTDAEQSLPGESEPLEGVQTKARVTPTIVDNSSTDDEPLLLPESDTKSNPSVMDTEENSPPLNKKQPGHSTNGQSSQGHTSQGQTKQGQGSPGQDKKSQSPQDFVSPGHSALPDKPVLTHQGESEPFSGLSPSPDLFGSQPFVQSIDDKVDEVEEEAIEEEPPSPSKVPETTRETGLYDVYYESAKVRGNIAEDKKFKLVGGAFEEEKVVEDKACLFCVGTPSPKHKPLVNKNRLKRKLFDPEPHFAPPGVSPASHVKTITGYLKRYQAYLRETQQSTDCKLEFKDPVVPGRHHEKTLFVKLRGEQDRDFNLEWGDDLEYGLPDIEDRPKVTVAAERRNGVKRPRRSFGDPENVDDDKDFVPSTKTKPKRPSEKKPTATRTLGVGKAMPRRQAMKEEAANTENVNLYGPFRRMGRNAVKKKADEEMAFGGETQRFDVLDEDENSNSSIPSAQPPSKSQAGKTKNGRRNSASSVLPSTSKAGDNESTHSSGKGSGRTTPTDSKLDQKSISSTHSSPLAFKLTGENTLVYSDNSGSDQEVESILKKVNEPVRKTAKKRKKTPFPEGTPESVSPTYDDYFADEAIHQSDKSKKAGEDIVLFESPDEEEPLAKNLKSGEGRTLKYGVKKKIVKRDNTQSASAGASAEKNSVKAGRGSRKQSVSPTTEKGEVQKLSQNLNTEIKEESSDVKQPAKHPGISSPDLGNRARSSRGQRSGPSHKPDQDPNTEQNQDTRRDGVTKGEEKRPLRLGTGPIKQQKRVVIYPVPGTQRLVTKIVTPEPEQVECPLCAKMFSVVLIVEHAATCQGPTEEDEEPQQQEQRPGPAPSQLAKRRAPIRQGGLADRGQEPTEYIRLGPTAAYANRGRMGANRGGHAAMEDYTIPKKMGQCPLCNTEMPQSQLQDHVEECLMRLETGEPGEQKEVGRLTRHSVQAGTKKPAETLTQGPSRASPTRQVIAVDSDDEDFTKEGGDLAVRKTRQRQSYMKDFMQNASGAIHTKPDATTKPRKMTLIPTPSSSSSTSLTARLGTSTSRRSDSPEPVIDAASSSGSYDSDSGSEDSSISDADDDVPLRTALTVPRRGRGGHRDPGGRGRGGTVSDPTFPNESSRPSSPIRTFRPISAIQSDSHIDFRNQFRRPQDGNATRGTKRKRASSGKGRKKKRRKTAGRGRGRGRGRKAPQPKQIKEAW